HRRRAAPRRVEPRRLKPAERSAFACACRVGVAPSPTPTLEARTKHAGGNDPHSRLFGPERDRHSGPAPVADPRASVRLVDARSADPTSRAAWVARSTDVAALGSAALSDPDPRVRAVAIAALVRTAPRRTSAPVWRRVAADADPAVRRRAAEVAPA